MGHAKQSRHRWKLEAQQVLRSPVLIPGNEWHPLSDGVEAPEYIPPQWDGVHVGKRMIEGFKTLSHLPERDKLSTASGFWPETFRTWEDLMSQDVDARELEANARNRIRIRPTAQEISRMDAVMTWPARYLNYKPPLSMRVVQTVAMLRARDFDLEKISRKLKMGPRHVRRINREALDTIAAGLRKDDVPVF